MYETRKLVVKDDFLHHYITNLYGAVSQRPNVDFFFKKKRVGWPPCHPMSPFCYDRAGSLVNRIAGFLAIPNLQTCLCKMKSWSRKHLGLMNEKVVFFMQRKSPPFSTGHNYDHSVCRGLGLCTYAQANYLWSTILQFEILFVLISAASCKQHLMHIIH